MRTCGRAAGWGQHVRHVVTALAENWRPRAQDVAEWLAPGQVFGPQNPGQKPPVPLPYINLGANLGKNKPEHIKKNSGHLMYPLQQVASRHLRRA